jgi:DNA invertase Pin-like site-specific DNA recombinase
MAQQAVVAGYFRVSQARDDMHAPELYTGEIERYCSYRGLELVKIFSDIDYSAFRGAKARPALEEFKARRAEFDAVIVPKLSRFGGSVKDLVRLFELFDRDGIALTFLDLNIDTSTSQGRLLHHILAAFAESDVKSDYSRQPPYDRVRGSPTRLAGPLRLHRGRQAQGQDLRDRQAAWLGQRLGWCFL